VKAKSVPDKQSFVKEQAQVYIKGC